MPARLTRQGRKKLRQFLEQVAIEVLSEARRRCPVDTGRLRASLTYEVIRTVDGKWRVIVGTNVNYAPYVEYGTVKMDAQPYLRPAVRAVKQRY